MRVDKMKAPDQAIQRWETEGGAPQRDSPQGPVLSRPKASKDATFAGDFLENPGFVGEMLDQWDTQ
jgi:hypothetical protein